MIEDVVMEEDEDDEDMVMFMSSENWNSNRPDYEVSGEFFFLKWVTLFVLRFNILPSSNISFYFLALYFFRVGFCQINSYSLTGLRCI